MLEEEKAKTKRNKKGAYVHSFNRVRPGTCIIKRVYGRKDYILLLGCDMAGNKYIAKFRLDFGVKGIVIGGGIFNDYETDVAIRENYIATNRPRLR